jgi:hypothetical protein
MKKATSIAGAMAMTALVALSSIVPAQAQVGPFGRGDDGVQQRERVIRTYCDRNRNDRDCRRFGEGRWRDRDYDRFYSSRRGSLDNIASGLFGFGFGALLGSAIANGNNNNSGGSPVYSGGNYQQHVNACFSRYRSYDEETDTFLGYDGVRRRCTL